jgi:hypothetical protein
VFDVIRFLDDHGIPWWGPGENVSAGHVGVSCPFCGDTYNHLGLDTKGRKRPYCWKCGSHSWYSYIKAVSGKTLRQVENEYGTILSHSTATAVEVPRGGAATCTPPGTKDFKKRHKKYLESRGFDPDYIIPKYDLRVTGAAPKFSYRIIIPIYLRGKIVSYQGRSYVDSKIKYLTCSPENEVVFHKNTLFNIDNARSRTGILVEGVFDAMKLGDNSVVSFGTALSSSQMNLLSHHFDRVFFIFDPEDKAQEIARKKATTLSAMGVNTELIELEEGDAGDLSVDDAIHLKSELGVI